MMIRRFLDYPSFSVRRSFSELDRLRREMERLTGEVFQKPGAGVYPQVNIGETKDSYIVRSEIPGVAAGDLEITATASNLTISGERKECACNEGVKYHRKERETGKFSRIISLPGRVETDKVAADFTNGVLTVTLPKEEATKPRQIQVN